MRLSHGLRACSGPTLARPFSDEESVCLAGLARRSLRTTTKSAGGDSCFLEKEQS
jgi:hypothetical protein